MGSEILFGLQVNKMEMKPLQVHNLKCITPVANITTFDLDVSVGAQIDFLAFFYRDCGNSRWILLQFMDT